MTFAVEGVKVSASILAAALLRRGVEVVVGSGLVDPVETLETTDDERPRRGVDLRELGIMS